MPAVRRTWAEWLFGGPARIAVPALCVLAASLVMALPVPLAWPVMPHLALLMVLLWAVVQPRLMPAWLALLLGIAHDSLAGAPIGLHGFLFVLLIVAIRLGERRAATRAFALAPVSASALVVAAYLVSWQIESLLLPPVPPGPHVAQAMLSCLAYPAMLRLVAWFQLQLTRAA